MYFQNFSLQSISSDINKTFIERLSYLLERLDSPLVDKEKIELTCRIENNDEYIRVYILHTTKEILNLLIEHNEIESTVELADAKFNFHEYREDNERVEDVINLISKIMHTTIEIHTFYKDKKIVKRKS